jgi:hypothetical protein
VVNARIHPVHFGDITDSIPFAIYYRVEEDVALVYAVLDWRRSPAWIRNRLGSGS